MEKSQNEWQTDHIFVCDGISESDTSRFRMLSSTNHLEIGIEVRQTIWFLLSDPPPFLGLGWVTLLPPSELFISSQDGLFRRDLFLLSAWRLSTSRKVPTQGSAAEQGTCFKAINSRTVTPKSYIREPVHALPFTRNRYYYTAISYGHCTIL